MQGIIENDIENAGRGVRILEQEFQRICASISSVSEKSKSIFSKYKPEDSVSEEDGKYLDTLQAEYKNLLEKKNTMAQRISNAKSMLEAEAQTAETVVNPSYGVQPMPSIDVRMDTNARELGGKLHKNYGFQKPYEFLGALIDMSKNVNTPNVRRLKEIMAVVPGVSSNTLELPPGGVLAPEEMMSLWRLSVESAPLGSRLNAPLSVTASTITIPQSVIAPWDKTAGVQASWVGQGAQVANTTPTFQAISIVLRKLAAIVPITDELVSQVPAFYDYIGMMMSDRLSYILEDAYLNGSGVLDPVGILSASNGSLITVSPGANNVLSYQDILNLKKRLLLRGSTVGQFFLAHPYLEPVLRAITTPGGTFYVFQNNLQGAGNERQLTSMFGIPIIFTPVMPLPTQGIALLLMDRDGYVRIRRSGAELQTAMSMHLYFDADAYALRVITTMGGRPVLDKPIADPNSKGKDAFNYSYFVGLGAISNLPI